MTQNEYAGRLRVAVSVMLVAAMLPMLAARTMADPTPVGAIAGPTTRPAAPDTYLASFAAECVKDWPRNRMLTVVCLGHSVVAGYASTPEVRAMDSYPRLLDATLADRYPHSVIRVVISAIGGENAVQGARRFDEDVLPLKPDVLLIDYALNDRALDLETVRAAWVEMIVKAQKRGARVILLTPTADSSAKLDDPSDPLNRCAEQVRGLSRLYGVALADSLATFKAAIAAGTPVESLLAQANHPNRRGHELVVSEVAKWFPKIAISRDTPATIRDPR